MYKKLIGLLVMMMLCAGLSAQEAAAEGDAKAAEGEATAEAVEGEEGENRLALSVTASVDYATKYVWRGINVTDEPVFQPSIDASLDLDRFTVGINWWANWDITDAGPRGVDEVFSEHDFTLYASTEVGGFGIEAGYINYYFPTATDTDEIYVGASKTLQIGTEALDVGLTWYRDIDKAQGHYLTASAEYSRELNEQFSLDLATSIGYADKDYNWFYYGQRSDAFTDFNISVGISASISEKVSASWTYNYSEVLDGRLDGGVLVDDNSWVNWNVTYAF